MSQTREKHDQAVFVDSVLWQYKSDPTFIRLLFFSTLNGAYLGGNGSAMYQRYKKEGFVNGVSDILYLQSRGEYGSLAIELKTEDRRREKRGGLSEDQEKFLLSVNAGGGLGVVCYGADEAIEVFARYMDLKPRSVSSDNLMIKSRAPGT